MFRQTISVFIKNIKQKKNENWSGLLKNLKADRLAQENELYQKLVEKKNFLQVVLERHRIVEEASVREQRCTGREKQEED